MSLSSIIEKHGPLVCNGPSDDTTAQTSVIAAEFAAEEVERFAFFLIEAYTDAGNVEVVDGINKGIRYFELLARYLNNEQTTVQ